MVNENMKKTERSWVLICIICFAVLYSANGFILSPACTAISNDIMYSDTAIPILLEFLAEAVEILAISVCYAVMLALFYKFGEKNARCVLWIFAAATAYKYLVNTAMSWIYGGSIPAEWIWDIVNIIYYTSLEFLQILIIFFVVKGIICAFTSKNRTMKKLSEKMGDGSEIVIEEAYPFNALYDKKNCILRSILICSVVTFIAKLGGSLISDIWSIVIFGLPADGLTWVLMLLNYISKMIFGAAVYFIVYAAVSRLLNRS